MIHENSPEVRVVAEALAGYRGGEHWRFHTMKAIKVIHALDAYRLTAAPDPALTPSSARGGALDSNGEG